MAATDVERVEFDGQPAWRKRYRSTRSALRITLLRWVARRLRLTALLPPAALDAAAACATERAFIERLSALGARVPDLLAVGDTELVLSDLGQTLSARCKAQSDPLRREELLRQGFDALAELHARGGCLNQAFARNLVCGDDGIGFIDLEEDPLTVMPLPAAQARDVLMYVHSTARFMLDAEPRYAALLNAHVAGEAADVQAEIGQVARRLRWLAPLARIGGRRARAVASALDVLARCAAVVLLVVLIGELSDDVARAADYLLDGRF
jgi:tRNA A-37 threonylcarbamoyl transferase component Bud32